MYNQRMADSRHYEDPVAKIDNGGLFSRERCRQLTQYLSPYIDSSSTCTTTTRTAFSKQSQPVRC